ncbi:hypothetical protein A2U01_0091795, partial [Trifolium medium]|nr:hypothetical protein [Trifolium medium]
RRRSPSQHSYPLSSFFVPINSVKMRLSPVVRLTLASRHHHVSTLQGWFKQSPPPWTALDYLPP